MSDVTAYSWPPLLAAVALRLLRHWDPACAIDDTPPDPHAPPGQPHGDSAGGAAPSASSPAELAPRLQPAQPSAGGASARKSDPMEAAWLAQCRDTSGTRPGHVRDMSEQVEAAAPASTSPACGGGAAVASPGGGGGLAVSVQAAGRASAEGGGCPDPAPSPRARVKRQGSRVAERSREEPRVAESDRPPKPTTRSCGSSAPLGSLGGLPPRSHLYCISSPPRLHLRPCRLARRPAANLAPLEAALVRRGRLRPRAALGLRRSEPAGACHPRAAGPVAVARPRGLQPAAAAAEAGPAARARRRRVRLAAHRQGGGRGDGEAEGGAGA